jgi:hypothetical protein
MVQRLLRSNDLAEMEREVKKFPTSLRRDLVEGQIRALKHFVSAPAELPAVAAAKLKASVTALYKNEPREGDVESIMRFVDERLNRLTGPLGSVSGRLSHQLGFMNPAPLRDDVFAAANRVAGAAPGCHKRFLALPTVVGMDGQGRTEVLLRLAYNEKLGSVKAHDLLKAAMKPNYTITKVVPLFAAFNNYGAEFSEDEEDGERALVSRLAAYWRGKRWDPICVRGFPKLPLRDFLDHVREAEAAKNKCSPNEVLLLVLVDGLRKLDDVPSARRAVLNAITDAQSTSNRSTTPFLPVVCSLDLNSIYAVVTSESKRPIANIQVVFPTTVDAEKLLKRVKTDASFPLQPTKRSEILQYFCCHLRHFRSIEVAWNDFKRGEVPTSRIGGSRAAYELFGELLGSPDEYMKEDRKFDGKSLHDLGMNPTNGVIYRQTNPDDNTVNPMVLPAALLRIYSDGRPVRPVDTLMHVLVCNALQLTLESAKNLVQAIPMAEAVAAHFRVAYMKTSPTLRDLWGTTDVTASGDVALDGIKLRGPKLSMDRSYAFVRRDPNPKPTIATGDTLVKNAWDAQNGCHFYWPGVANYSAIGGVAAYHVCDRPIAVQMKTSGNVNPAVIRTTLDDMRGKTRELGAPKNTLHVLYLMQELPPRIEPLPERCVVVGREGVRRLLVPFGDHTALLLSSFEE